MSSGMDSESEPHSVHPSQLDVVHKRSECASSISLSRLMFDVIKANVILSQKQLRTVQDWGFFFLLIATFLVQKE